MISINSNGSHLTTQLNRLVQGISITPFQITGTRLALAQEG